MKILFNILLFSLFVNVGCTYKQDEVFQKIGTSFQLKVSESANFSDNGNAISAKLINIQEGRCPVNVQCVRAGEVIVVLDLKIGDEQFNGLKVCVGCEKQMNIPVLIPIKAKNKTYSVQLNSVDPYPQSTGINSQTATLIIN